MIIVRGCSENSVSNSQEDQYWVPDMKKLGKIKRQKIIETLKNRIVQKLNESRKELSWKQLGEESMKQVIKREEDINKSLIEILKSSKGDIWRKCFPNLSNF